MRVPLVRQFASPRLSFVLGLADARNGPGTRPPEAGCAGRGGAVSSYVLRTARSVMSSACSEPAAWESTAALDRVEERRCGRDGLTEQGEEAPLSVEAGGAPRVGHAIGKGEQSLPHLQPRLPDFKGHVRHQADGRPAGGKARFDAPGAEEDRRLVPAVDVEERAGRGIEHPEEECREHVGFAVRSSDVVVDQPDGPQQLRGRIRLPGGAGRGGSQEAAEEGHEERRADPLSQTSATTRPIRPEEGSGKAS